MVSAILLAAGESKRMGKLKQLIPWGKTTMVERAIDNLLNSNVSEVIAVLGYRAEEIMEKIATKSIKVAVNPTYHQGMSTSIITGLNLIDDRARAIMLALADQPLIDSQIINRLIDEFCDHSKGIVIPTYQNKRGHPVIFAIKYKEELLRLQGDIGGRQIIKEHPDDILEVAVASPSINIDIDTTSNYHSHLD